jgi:bilirubin oxidase
MFTRRNVLKSILALAVAPIYIFKSARAKTIFKNLFVTPPLDLGVRKGPDVYFNLNLQSGQSAILPNVMTPTWGINQTFLGGTLRARKGDNVHINVTNDLPETSTLHWHGVKLPAYADGGPHQPIQPSETWLSEYTIDQPAATLWYHSHQLHKTGEQVYNGLAGMFIVDDEQSELLNLPSAYGVDDFPVIIQDRDFNDDGSLNYLSRLDLEKGLRGVKGEVMLVNGVITPTLAVTKSLIRLRILNGSNARVYQLLFDDNRSFKVIASDGGLLEAPEVTQTIKLAPGERAEIVVDVIDGGMPQLLHRPGHDLMPNMKKLSIIQKIGMAIFGNDEDVKSEFEIMQIDASKVTTSDASVPNQLTIHTDLSTHSIAMRRVMTLKMESGSPLIFLSSAILGSRDLMTINDKSMDINRIDERVKAGSVEVWEIRNKSRMLHPFHIHNVQFKIVSRLGGLHDHEKGFKDVVIVYPGERVEVIMKFPEFRDENTPYMYHCHILEHEDRGMMGQFVVV